MYKRAAAVLVLAVMLMLAGCAGQPQPKEFTVSVPELLPPEITFPEDRYREVSGDMLYDAGGITIWATELDYEGFIDPTLGLTMVNLSDEDVSVRAEYVYINGALLTDCLMMGMEAPAGMSASGMLLLEPMELEYAGIGSIQQIDLSLTIRNQDFETIAVSDLTTVHVEDDAPIQPLRDDGITLVEQDGVRVIFQGVDNREYGRCHYVHFCVENQTDRTLTLSNERVLINGVNIERDFYTFWGSYDIAPSAFGYFKMQFTFTPLKEKGIDAMESIQLQFVATDTETGEELFPIAPILLHLEDYHPSFEE